MSQKYDISPQDGGGLIRWPGRGWVFGAGDTKPSDGVTGWATGCLFLDTNGTDADTILYLNIGDKTSANFDIIFGTPIAGVTAGTVTASKAMIVDTNKRIFGLVGLEIGLGTTQLTISDGDGTTALVPETQIQGTTKATSSMLIAGFNTTNDSTVAPSLNFLKSGHGTIGTFTTAVASGETLGEINFFGADGTDAKSPAARIAGLVDAAVGAGDMPGRLVFQTSIDTGETLTTAMTIDSAQTVTCSKGLVAKSNSAAAITTTRALTAADSGGIFSIAKTSAYAITLPTPAQGIRFKFVALDTGANIVTISDGSAHLIGMADVTGTPVAMNGTTLSLASGGSIGDWVEFEGIDATHYLVTGACKDAADITIA
jgi:hypothetical protein